MNITTQEPATVVTIIHVGTAAPILYERGNAVITLEADRGDGRIPYIMGFPW